MTTIPIFVIRIPYHTENLEDSMKVYKQISDKLFDYHVLFIRENNLNEIKFELFSVENTNPIEFEELKSRVMPYLKPTENSSLKTEEYGC